MSQIIKPIFFKVGECFISTLSGMGNPAAKYMIIQMPKNENLIGFLDLNEGFVRQQRTIEVGDPERITEKELINLLGDDEILIYLTGHLLFVNGHLSYHEGSTLADQFVTIDDAKYQFIKDEHDVKINAK